MAKVIRKCFFCEAEVKIVEEELHDEVPFYLCNECSEESGLELDELLKAEAYESAAAKVG